MKMFSVFVTDVSPFPTPVVVLPIFHVLFRATAVNSTFGLTITSWVTTNDAEGTRREAQGDQTQEVLQNPQKGA